MMSVKQIREVRMLRQEGLPIRDICRKAGVSRNTVRKILRGKQADIFRQFMDTLEELGKVRLERTSCGRDWEEGI